LVGRRADEEDWLVSLLKLLIHSPNDAGGLAEHTHYQARAFAAAGVEVTVLCPPAYAQMRKANYPLACVYRTPPSRPSKESSMGKGLRIAKMVLCLLYNQWRLAIEVWRRKPEAVLLESYMEYLAPLWIWPHMLLSRFRGVTYVANLHDPVRDFQVGPAWWHRLSVTMGYWPLSVVVVHQKLPSLAAIPDRIQVVEAPVGVYDLESKPVDVREVRRLWGFPEDAVVFLSFGFIRDNKNLDLLIRALVDNAQAVLVVMGRAQSSTQRPLAYYENLAAGLGVSDRVRFRGEFVADEELGGYFAAADCIAITYSSQFFSQSGVLNIAARARKPVLASSGDSPLKTSVERFCLGEFVEPDDVAALSRGMATVCANIRDTGKRAAPDWEGYTAYASWQTNAEVILKAISEVAARNRERAA